MTGIWCVSRAAPLPFEVTAAARGAEAVRKAAEAGEVLPTVGQVRGGAGRGTAAGWGGWLRRLRACAGAAVCCPAGCRAFLCGRRRSAWWCSAGAGCCACLAPPAHPPAHPLPSPPQDVRLDNRFVDLRTPANQAIFRVQSAVCQVRCGWAPLAPCRWCGAAACAALAAAGWHRCHRAATWAHPFDPLPARPARPAPQLFRESLQAEDFIEIHTPKLLAGASEGGAAVFRFDYMGRPGCLAQSPQFYKQARGRAGAAGVQVQGRRAARECRQRASVLAARRCALLPADPRPTLPRPRRHPARRWPSVPTWAA